MPSPGRLSNHRSGAESVADLLVYASVVDDGVIVGKNGSLISGWLFSMEDMSTVTNDRREVLASRINAALRELGNGWMLHIDAVRRAVPEYYPENSSSFPDSVSAALDEERRELFEKIGTVYDGYFVLVATWLPPSLMQRRFTELMFDDDSKPLNRDEQSQSLLAHFSEKVQKLQNKLSSGMVLTRLKAHEFTDPLGEVQKSDELLSWLHYCLTGIRQPIRLPNTPTYIDRLVGGQELFGGVIPKIGNKFISVVAIEGLPMESYPGMIQSLAELNFEYRWSTRFIFMDQHEALNHLKKFSAQWSQKIVGFVDQLLNRQGRVNQDAVDMVRDGDAAIAELQSGHVACGYYTANIVIMASDRELLKRQSEQALSIVERHGFVGRIESINTMEAYLGTLPGHGIENIRRPLINTMNLADLIPSSSIWSGRDTAPCPLYPKESPALMRCLSTGSTPFNFNLHVGDVGHTLMLGPTGAGKSTHLGILAAQLLRYEGMSVYVFEKGKSMYALTRALGGLHYDIGGDSSQVCFCPLQHLATKDDIAWAANWIGTILALNDLKTTPQQNNEIADALQRLHEAGGKTLSEFAITVQDNEIREVLRQYTCAGSMGHLLDGEEETLQLPNFTTFETEELLGYQPKFALPTLLYIFRRIEKQLTGRPAAIILDEAWTLLGNEVFRQKIREWLKVLRKSNCSVVMATQNISDATKSGILDVIIESTSTKIYLANEEAEGEDMKQFYKRVGLNDREISIVRNATPKRQYYFRSSEGRRLYELGLGPLALSIVGATDKDSVRRIKELESHFGHDEWLPRWLEERGVIPGGERASS